MRPADLPLVKMYPIILIAALTRGSKVCFRVAKGDDGVGHNGLRQSEQLLLGLHPVHLGPGAQPDCAKPQLLCSKADVLGGNGSVNDPVVLGKAERTVKVAANEDTGSGSAGRPLASAICASFSGSVTTTKDQSRALTQLGPLMAASSSWCRVSLLMGLSVNSRQLRRVRMASRVFIDQCLLF